jgi:beta-glucosidase
MGEEIYPPSLANAVEYGQQMTGVPILVTEHGLSTPNDEDRAAFIPAALVCLQDTIAKGVPVLGYIHWSLLDNFEWIFGYEPKYGLIEVDRQSFKRTPKPSSAVLGGIAKANEI